MHLKKIPLILQLFMLLSSNALLLNAVLSLVKGLPKRLPIGSFVHYIPQKPHYISHRIMHVNSIVVTTLPCNSIILLCYSKIIGYPINLFLILIILTCKYNLLFLSTWLAIWFYQIKGPVIASIYVTVFWIHYVKAKTALYEITLLVVYLLPFNCH